MLNIRDLITIKDGKYMVISKVELEGVIYYYLANTLKNDDFMFCSVDGDELVQILNDDLIKKLIPLFGEQAIKELNEYMKKA